VTIPAGTTRFQRKFFFAAMTTAVIALGVAGVDGHHHAAADR
jgi:hypothetical protein